MPFTSEASTVGRLPAACSKIAHIFSVMSECLTTKSAKIGNEHIVRR